MANESLRNTP